VRLGVPSLARINVNEEARLELLFAPLKVKVQLPFKVAVNTCAVPTLIVCAVPVFPIAETLSEKMPVRKLASTLSSPVPLGVMFNPTLVSPPEGVIVGLAPVAALANVISLTAEAVAVRFISSKPFVSRMSVPILGLVKVLLVSVNQLLLEASLY
jgi:hypothetical protein